MRKYILVLLALLSVGMASAQSLSLEFPHFAGQGWYYRVFQGNKMDTIAKGALDEAGKVRIEIPEAYKNHRGMSQWLLTLGGGLDVILGSDNVQISCMDADPSQGDIVYQSATEHDFLTSRYKAQQSIFARIDALRATIQAFESDGDLQQTLEKELTKQFSEYQQLIADSKATPLYAARFGEIVDFTRGYGKSLSRDMEQNNRELMEFVTTDLQFEDLYTSGHWEGVLATWLEFYGQSNLSDKEIDAQVISDYNRMKNRISDEIVRHQFMTTIHDLLAKNGKVVLANKINVVGLTAPDFAVSTENKLSTIEGKRLLFFYGSFCDLCQDEIHALSRKVEDLKAKGISVIGIDSDPESKQVRPWAYNVVDSKFAINMSYDVGQTPSYILIDEKGIVVDKYRKVMDM